jgi:hypothetical protein
MSRVTLQFHTLAELALFIKFAFPSGYFIDTQLLTVRTRLCEQDIAFIKEQCGVIEIAANHNNATTPSS